jgi:hypothetical protein
MNIFSLLNQTVAMKNLKGSAINSPPLLNRNSTHSSWATVNIQHLVLVRCNYSNLIFIKSVNKPELCFGQL